MISQNIIIAATTVISAKCMAISNNFKVAHFISVMLMNFSVIFIGFLSLFFQPVSYSTTLSVMLQANFKRMYFPVFSKELRCHFSQPGVPAPL